MPLPGGRPTESPGPFRASRTDGLASRGAGVLTVLRSLAVQGIHDEETTMRRTAAAVLTLALAGVALAGPAHAAPPTPGGCQAFGRNVASLAKNLGPAFGATASGVAKSGPGAFPKNVVKPEQEALCP